MEDKREGKKMFSKNSPKLDSVKSKELTDKLLSIIVPVYNVEKYISECMDSLLKQTYSNIEIILIDDGSKDKSGDICDYYARKNSCIKVIHKKNAGVSAARNDGLQVARGEYISFVDSDDVIADDIYSTLIDKIERTSSDCACCTYFNFDEKRVKSVEAQFQGICTGNKAFEVLLEEPAYTVVIWNKVFKREVLCLDKECLLFEEGVTMGEDELWLSRVLCNTKNKMAFVNKPLYYWRRRENSATHIKQNRVTRQQKDGITVLNKLLKFARNDGSENLERLLTMRMMELSFKIAKECYQRRDWMEFSNYYKLYNAMLKSESGVGLKNVRYLVWRGRMKLKYVMMCHLKQDC